MRAGVLSLLCGRALCGRSRQSQVSPDFRVDFWVWDVKGRDAKIAGRQELWGCPGCEEPQSSARSR